MINYELLSEICRIPGAPGFEKRIRDYVHDLVKPHASETNIDRMGNLIAVKKGKSNEKVIIAAHLDEIGFIVTHIDANGFLRFHTLGGFDPKTLTAQRVIVHGREDLIGVMGTKPIHVMSPEERTKMPKNTDFYIDLGLPKEEVEKLVRVGDAVTREREMVRMGDCVNVKSLDNRVSVFIALEMLKELENPEMTVVVAFTVQEEVGIRGAEVAAQHVNAEYAINLDVTIAYDLPGAPEHEKVTSLGKGAAIKVLDGMTICDQRMVECMRKTAESQNIPYQMEILTAGGTDTAGLQRRAEFGSVAGGISIPCRYLHQVTEMVHAGDVRHCIDLLKATIQAIPSHDWSW